MRRRDLPDFSKANAAHKARLNSYAVEVMRLLDRYCFAASSLAHDMRPDPTKQFFWSDYPLLSKAIERLGRELVKGIEGVVYSGIGAEWEQSNLLQDLVAQKVLTRYIGQSKSGEEYTRYYQTHPEALSAFIKRRERGLLLSDRIWNLEERTKTRLEMAITANIASGTSAAALSIQVRDCLKDPDLMFRRFRYKDAAGEWKRKWKIRQRDGAGNVYFIDCDKETFPTGRGYYKSAYKNAMRLTRTEINAAYRTAEQKRWEDMDFVVGYEVKTTQNGKHVPDICDDLAGKYPKTFKFTGWHPQCYSDDSEVLTNSGWKLFKDVSKSDKILSLNPETRAPEWVGIVDTQCYEHDGRMIRFFNKSLDCLVTPEHRMVYLNKSNGEIRYCQAKDYTKGKGALYRGAIYRGVERDFFEIEGKKISFDDFCEFMGYYLSDGSLQHGTGVCIAQQEGETAYHSILEVCRRMGYDPKVGQPNICIYNSALNRYLKQFGRCTEKFIPEEIKTASIRQIRIFLDAFLKCDGHVRSPRSFIGNHGNAFHSEKSECTYYSTSGRMAGDLSELILKVGHRPSFSIQDPKTTQKKDGSVIKGNHICYRITECYSTTATVFRKENVQYSGMVYDLTLERNHIMYIRRNGKCFWGSNCMCYTIPILKTEEEFWSLDQDKPSVNEVTDVPDNFKEWIADNSDRIEKATERGTLPYFIKDNRGVVAEVLQSKEKPQENNQEERHEDKQEDKQSQQADRERIEANRKEYQEYADKGWNLLYFDEESGGYNVAHPMHQFKNSKPKGVPKTGGEAEKWLGSQLAKQGKVVEFLPESGVNGKSGDMRIAGMVWDCKYIPLANTNTVRSYIKDARKADRVIFCWEEESRLDVVRSAIASEVGNFRKKNRLNELPDIYWADAKGKLHLLWKK